MSTVEYLSIRSQTETKIKTDNSMTYCCSRKFRRCQSEGYTFFFVSVSNELAYSSACGLFWLLFLATSSSAFDWGKREKWREVVRGCSVHWGPNSVLRFFDSVQQLGLISICWVALQLPYVVNIAGTRPRAERDYVAALASGDGRARELTSKSQR